MSLTGDTRIAHQAQDKLIQGAAQERVAGSGLQCVYSVTEEKAEETQGSEMKYFFTSENSGSIKQEIIIVNQAAGSVQQ